RLIQGISHYADDLRLPGLLHCVFVRSPHAYAKIARVDTTAARQTAGVVAVFTAEDLGPLGNVPCAGALPDLKVPPHPALARGFVRYVGEPVVAIVAQDAYSARDAADKVDIDYEQRQAIVDMEKAIASGADRVHDQFDSNVAFNFPLKNGDVAGAFKKADRVVKARLVNQRLAPIPMEPRGVVAQFLPGE